MEQHPIPQQISSYEFKLVGEMTLSQFAKAAGGIVLAFLINASGLFWLLRIPLMILTGGGGLVLAFVPINDRPAEVWVKAFLKSIYSPTIYIYKKAINKNWLDWQRREKEGAETEEVEIKSKNKGRLEEFLNRLPRRGEVDMTDLVKTEKRKKKVKTKREEKKKRLEVKREVKTEKKEEELKEPREDWREKKVVLNLKRKRLKATGEAVFGSIPMPRIPEVPNVIVGMVTDSKGKIVEDAIVEIQDEKGNPSRVLKTNSLGQFRSSTPLANGKYLIITEKGEEKFDRVNIDLRGEIVRPIKIKART